MKYLMIYFVLLLTLASCKKEETQPELPPETTTGENTAGFVVDGKTIVLPKDAYSSVPGGGQGYGISIETGPNFNSPNSSRYFTVRIRNLGDKLTYDAIIRIHESPTQTKIYTFGKNNEEYFADGPNYPQMTVIVGGRNSETEWYYSKNQSGSITFTEIDTSESVYSGTFEATLYNRFDPSKTMKITKGRFDINLKTLNK